MTRTLPPPTRWLYLFIGLAVCINFSALFIPIIGPDGTLYALIAKTMVQRNNYVEFFVHGQDWLDKPHFPFWITALFFKCFGFTTWAYKLPGILFLMMGAWYTYLFAKELYNKEIALWSALILLTAQHIVLSNNDVRAEPYLTGLIIAAVYHFYKANLYNNYWQLLWGCVFTACAIMTKGMFAIIPIGGAMAGQFIIAREWRKLFNVKWIVALILTGVLIIPELWALYKQFDLHPEKVIFGHTHVSGIKFFFWDSQFGRFFNTGPIKGSGDPSFFIHTTLWAFLPWSLLLFAAIFQFIKNGSKHVKTYEWYCVSGALLTFLVFSLSKFQLPYYLNIVFPFFAIITAEYLYYTQQPKSLRAVGFTQAFVITAMLVILNVLQYFFQPQIFSLYTGGTIGLLFLLLIFLPDVVDVDIYQKIAFRTVLMSFIVNLYLNLAFYPSLLKYQAGSEAAMWINTHNPQNLPVAELHYDYANAFDFYCNADIKLITSLQKPATPFLLYAEPDVIKGLAGKGWHVRILTTFKSYWVSRLSPKFLNRLTRDKQLTTTQVALVN
jgi:4-amino-4-deoxy-L-arabinose transferase-like glycosyltransferase